MKEAEKIKEDMEVLLADLFTLYLKVRNFHWNVKGKSFFELHKFFQDLYEEIDDMIDNVAERIRTLGFHAPGTIGEFMKITEIPENPGSEFSPEDMMKQLIKDCEILSGRIKKILRLNQEDFATQELLSGILFKIEKKIWMMKSFLG